MLGENANPALDVNVEPAWIQGLTGCHVIVGVVDDGEHTRHYENIQHLYYTEFTDLK